MKSVLGPQLGANHSMMLRNRVRVVTQTRTHGTQRIPEAPRGLVVQSGQSGALLTWHLPKRYNDVTGYRIYTDTEKNLSVQIRDRGTRQQFVPLTSGNTPPLSNIFVSAVNGFREGPRVQVQVKAQSNSTATTQIVPLPQFDFVNQFSGGLDKTQSGQPSGKKTP
jgi:hypothetical protein